ncbi:alanine--tRNA ligase-related protein [Candidatus Hodgkinia cicadicola]
MISSVALRQAFFKHFVAWGHMPISSFSVRSSKAGLLFNNSGMVPLYNMFYSGSVKAPLCNVQKCVRLGGKHNDYFNIGSSRRHLSFFEMMGGFSFGNYNKLYAIQMVWEFLIRLGLSVDKLVVTVHAADLDTAAVWRRVAGTELKVLSTYGEQNVWKAGDAGLCGLCTEVYCVNKFELWEVLNVVFVTHNQLGDGCKRLELSCIDIGIGLERMLAALDGGFDVYLTDELARAAAAARLNRELSAIHRVLLDHTRCASFIIIDGVLPANTGAGYVLRKIIRRCVTELLVVHQSLSSLYELFAYFVNECVADVTSAAYSRALNVFSSEVSLYLNTISANVARLKLYGSVERCYDTFGIPSRLLEALMPDLFNGNKCSKHVTIVYSNKSVVFSKVLCQQRYCLALSKTNLAATGIYQIGDQGVLVGDDFGLIVRRAVVNNKCYHTVTELMCICAGELVYVFKNYYLYELCCVCHFSLRALIKIVNLSFRGVGVVFAKADYLGFVLELECVEVLVLERFLASVLHEQRAPVLVQCRFVKRASSLVKFINVSAFGFSFMEECCEACALVDVSYCFCYDLYRLSKTQLRLEARVDLLAPTAHNKVVRACAHARTICQRVCNTFDSSPFISISLSHKLIRWAPLPTPALYSVFSKFLPLECNERGCFRFTSRSDLISSLILVKSVLFLLNLRFIIKNEQTQKQ